MSEQDLNTIIVKLVKKLFWMLIVPVLVILVSAKVIDIRTQNKRAEGYYIELFRLNAELTTMLTEYIRADEREKDRIWEQIESIMERMDKYALHEVYRGETIIEQEERKKQYGINFTSLI